MMSEHLRLEVATAIHRGRPLEPGAPVPGCACPACTGLPADHPARLPAWRHRDPNRAIMADEARRQEWERTVAAARSVPVVEVARRLGCGDPVRRGKELQVRCPLHQDRHPSLRIASDGRRWFCDPCGEGGDGIALYMRARRVDFAQAVRELAP